MYEREQGRERERTQWSPTIEKMRGEFQFPLDEGESVCVRVFVVVAI